MIVDNICIGFKNLITKVQILPKSHRTVFFSRRLTLILVVANIIQCFL